MECYNKKIVRNLKRYESIESIAKQQELSIDRKLIKKEIIESNRYISKCLELSLATKVQYLKTIYFLDNNAFLIENVWIPYVHTSGIEENQWIDMEVFTCLKKIYGKQLKERNEELRIVRTTNEESEIFNISLENQLLMMRGTVTNTENHIIAYFENYALPSIFEFKE